MTASSQIQSHETTRGTTKAESARSSVEQLAAAVLTLAAAGQAVPDVLLNLLAEGVLAAPLPALALAVQSGGEHQLRRAIELAELVRRVEQARFCRPLSGTGI